jgi:hypothetical protein
MDSRLDEGGDLAHRDERGMHTLASLPSIPVERLFTIQFLALYREHICTLLSYVTEF